MVWIQSLAALALPWITGAVWVRLLWSARPGAGAAIAGYGFFIGLWATTLLMRLWDLVGLKQNGPGMLAGLGVLIGLGLWLQARRGARGGVQDTPPQGGGLSRGTRIVFWGLVALILLRLTGLALELAWRPLFAWDAWMNWAPKARVWFEWRELVPFVRHEAWLSGAADAGAYTLANEGTWRYPIFVPLVQLWMAVNLGVWDDSLINLPWVLAFGALGMALYGQIRGWGRHPLVALVATYLVLSLPFVDTHVALAGYADLWLASFYALAAMAFFDWLRCRDPAQGLLAVLLAVACLQTKVPGVLWVATLVAGLVATLTPGRWLVAGGGALLLAVAAILVVGGVEATLPGLGTVHLSAQRIALPLIGSHPIAFHPVWRPFLASQYVHGSWHLLWYLLVAAWAWVLWEVARGRLRLDKGVSAVVLSAVGIIFVVFFLTGHYKAVENFTTVNRALFHIAPTLVAGLVFAVGGAARGSSGTAPVGASGPREGVAA